jgi:poly(ADP-ribose) glycohydrolase ARH3
MLCWMREPADSAGGLDVIADRAAGAVFGTFVGDALGMPFEGLSHTAIPETVEMVEARRGRGTYTDDTQMMIALSESLIARGGIDAEDLARSFLDSYEPDRGYGRGTRRVFKLWRQGVPARLAAGQVFDGRGSRGNGAAMRIAPVAVFFRDDPDRLRAQAAASARVTHAHPVGVDGAVVQAAAIGAALRGDNILDVARETARTLELGRALEEVETLLGVVRTPGEVQGHLGSSADIAESVAAALYSALAHDRFEAAVRFGVRLGGDTDTVAAMAGAVAGARDGYRAIPSRWVEALEDGGRGRSHVQTLVTPLCRAGYR